MKIAKPKTILGNLKWSCVPIGPSPRGRRQKPNWHKGPLMISHGYDGYQILHVEIGLPPCNHRSFARLSDAKRAVDGILSFPGALAAYESCGQGWPDDKDHERIAKATKKVLRHERTDWP